MSDSDLNKIFNDNNLWNNYANMKQIKEVCNAYGEQNIIREQNIIKSNIRDIYNDNFPTIDPIENRRGRNPANPDVFISPVVPVSPTPVTKPIPPPPLVDPNNPPKRKIDLGTT